MVLNFTKLRQQQDAMLSSLRDRTKTYLNKWGYTQRQLAEAVQISETHLNDFLQAKRGLSETAFFKIEHVLSLNATQRKLQFYKSGNTGARFCNMQHKGQNIPGQIKLAKYDNGAVNETHAAFSKYNQDRMEA
jgi:transcriptional regulator with XRE-family HTH domain